MHSSKMLSNFYFKVQKKQANISNITKAYNSAFDVAETHGYSMIKLMSQDKNYYYFKCWNQDVDSDKYRPTV